MAINSTQHLKPLLVKVTFVRNPLTFEETQLLREMQATLKKAAKNRVFAEAFQL